MADKVCEACKTIPPVVSEGYQEKGSYSQLGGLKTYVTGEPSSKTGVLVVYDIFGYYPQTIQGADIISAAHHLVAMPDFFEGSPMPMSYFPPDTEERKKNMGEFFSTKAMPPQGHMEKAHKVLADLQEKYPSVQKWAVIGYCWGGKIATLLSLEGSKFAASVQIHPAMLDKADAEKISIPHYCISTKDEDKGVTEEVEAVLKGKGGVVAEKSKVEYWGGTFHGFMAARSNLQDKENFEYYQKGYQEVVNWLQTVL